MTRTRKKRSAFERTDPVLRERRAASEAGYQHCGCRDCFEVAIGHPGDFCWECDEAGCEPDSECKVERDGE